MKIIDRFHKPDLFQFFDLNTLSKKSKLKKRPTQIDPCDHLLNFILNKSSSQATPRKPTRRSSLFESSPRMRPTKKNQSRCSFSKILVDSDERTIPLSGVSNDFYSHMVDSISSDLIALGLFGQLIIFSLDRSSFFRVFEKESELLLESLTSINVNPNNPDKLALGNSEGIVSLADLHRDVLFQRFKKHFLRVGSIKFHPLRPHLLASGSKDCSVVVHDIRAKSGPIPLISFEHKGEICGLSWQSSGFCLASGGNDNLIQIWDLRKTSGPLLQIRDHAAAVRALEFCPTNDNFLASGGGTGDSSIRITSLRDQGRNSVVLRTQSQICSLLWDQQCNRLLTSHGFSKYQLCLWNLEKEKLVSEYYGHSNRILDIVRMRRSSLVLSFSSDNSAKLWNPFKAPLKSRNNVFTPIKLR